MLPIISVPGDVLRFRNLGGELGGVNSSLFRERGYVILQSSVSGIRSGGDIGDAVILDDADGTAGELEVRKDDGRLLRACIPRDCSTR